MRARPVAFYALLPLALVALGSAFGAHQWARFHVEHYTGDAVKTTNCILCHVDAKSGSWRDRWEKPRYMTPRGIAACPDGTKLYVTAQDADLLLEVDPVQGKVTAEIPVGRRPHTAVLSNDCRRAYVSNEYSHSISVVDLVEHQVVASLPSGVAPEGLALSKRAETLYVANWLSHDISVLDLASGKEGPRLAAGSNPTAFAHIPGSHQLLLANQLARPVRFPNMPVSEISVVDMETRRVVHRYPIPNAHLLEGIAVVPEGDLALITAVRPRNLLPALQVERGWMMTNGLVVIELGSGRIIQLPLDDPNSFYADPSDVAITPDGRYAFVTHGGVDLISVVDLRSLRELIHTSKAEDLERYANKLSMSHRYVAKRIETGANPRGMAVSPDGSYLYVAERLEDRLAVVDIEKLERVRSIDLGGSPYQSVHRLGEKVFHNAEIALQNQFSCRSCHPNGHVDGLQYDLEPDGLGRGVVDNRTLLGIRDTGPFKWNGKNTSLYMQCGIRFARFLTRSEPFTMEKLNALVAYISALELPPNPYSPPDGNLTPGQQRGKEIFERTRTRDGKEIRIRDRCSTCHPPGEFTHRQSDDVGSISPWDDAAEGKGKAFDTPQLRNLWMSAPYLHDGKALTLEEIWTLYSPDDTHGITSDLGKDGLNDLIEYLRTL